MRNFSFIGLNRFVDDICKIQICLPSASKDMITAFIQQEKVSHTTVRIWAEQGVLGVTDGRIIKLNPRPLTDTQRQDAALQIMRMLQKPDNRRPLPLPPPRGFGG